METSANNKYLFCLFLWPDKGMIIVYSVGLGISRNWISLCSFSVITNRKHGFIVYKSENVIDNNR